MDLRGDMNFESQIMTLIGRMLTGVHTSIPGTVLEFDAATQTATVQPAIRKKVTLAEGVQSIPQPQLFKCPVVFPYSQTAGFSVCMPVQAGDSVLLIYAETSIDNWQDRGGESEPVEDTVSRAHDITDAIAIIGLTPSTTPVSGYPDGKSIQIRNKDQSVQIEVFNDNLKIQNLTGGKNSWLHMKPNGSIEIFSDVQVDITTPKIQFYGTSGDVGTDGVSLVNHWHGGVRGGSEFTSPPIKAG